MKKISNWGYKFICIFTFIVLFIAFIGSIFFYVNRSYNYFNPFLLILGSILYLIFLIKLYRYIITLSAKKKKIICISLLIVQFVLLLSSFFIISSIPKVDLIHILTEINSLNETGHLLNNTYFSVYPNNRFLLMLLYNIQKINPSKSKIIFGLLSTFSISIMSLFTYKTVKKIYNQDKAILSLFITVLSPIFYLYVSYYYTDILMMPFASILIYLLVLNKKEDEFKKNIIFGIFIGILAGLAYKIRAVAIFPLIAFIVYLIFTSNFKNIIKKIIPIFISLILTLGLVKEAESKLFINMDSNKEFPVTHWIMMGFNEKSNGYYSQDDYDYSASAKTKEERSSFNIKCLKERISNLGPWKMTKLLVIKIVSVWGKGDYSYQKYLDLVNDYNVSYRYLILDKNIIINYLLQFSKIVILFMCLISIINAYKDKENKSFLLIAIFGAILFYLIWEVCPRYGLSFLPWLIIFSSSSFDNLIKNYEKIENKKIWKYLVIISTIILFLIGFNKYTTYTNKENIAGKDIVNKTRYINLKDNVIKQSLKLNLQFNQIKLRFNLLSKNENAKITIKLLNENEKIIETQVINTNDLSKNGYANISLGKDYAPGKYFIEISSNNDINVYISYKEMFDYYPEGTLYVNNIKENGDLMFELSYIGKYPTYSKIEYIVILVISLGIEYVILFKRKKEL